MTAAEFLVQSTRIESGAEALRALCATAYSRSGAGTSAANQAQQSLLVYAILRVADALDLENATRAVSDAQR